jgi:uncharacterized membrane protein YhaH (DUF805 family)
MSVGPSNISEETVMTFSRAVRDAFAKYAVFSGRSSRSAYWWWYLFDLLVTAAAYAVSAAIGSSVIYLLAILGLLLPGLAVLVRRLHDAGHSGWWALIAIVPLIGFIVLLVMTVQPSEGPNQWGAGPDAATDLRAPAGAV